MDLGDCTIPVNINKRKFELDNFRENYYKVVKEFNDSIEADESYEGDFLSEKQIKE